MENNLFFPLQMIDRLNDNRKTQQYVPIGDYYDIQDVHHEDLHVVMSPAVLI